MTQSQVGVVGQLLRHRPNAVEGSHHQRPSAIAQAWRRNRERIIRIFDYPNEIHRAIYTSNIIESLNYTLKKGVKTRGAFLDEDSLFKVLYLAIQNAHPRLEKGPQLVCHPLRRTAH
ncbi:MAG: transposase [Thermaceae bacterium]|nr:transposase [Thermaceae bacterium]